MRTIEKFLEEKQVKPTAMRILIFKYLAQKQLAVALTDIETDFEKSDRSTIYRTIKTFEDSGIVHLVEDGSGVLKYALCEAGCNCELDSDLHLHFHCETCKETQCLTETKIPHINLPPGFTATDASLVVKGTCDKCNSE